MRSLARHQFHIAIDESQAETHLQTGPVLHLDVYLDVFSRTWLTERIADRVREIGFSAAIGFVCVSASFRLMFRS